MESEFEGALLGSVLEGIMDLIEYTTSRVYGLSFLSRQYKIFKPWTKMQYLRIYISLQP